MCSSGEGVLPYQVSLGAGGGGGYGISPPLLVTPASPDLGIFAPYSCLMQYYFKLF